jgi:hypothetical protein
VTTEDIFIGCSRHRGFDYNCHPCLVETTLRLCAHVRKIEEKEEATRDDRRLL